MRCLQLLALITVISMIPKQCFAQLIIAHRGASHAAPENTLASFRQAWSEGADGIEGDFYLTADKQIVCIHDKDTKRTTGKKLVVSESTLDELRKLDAGSWKDAKYTGEKIPTFAEVAACVPKNKWFFIELKFGPEIVGPLKHELAQSGLDPNRIVIISFNVDTLAECKRQMPEIAIQWLSGFKRPNAWSPVAPTAVEVLDAVQKSGADSAGLQCNIDVIDAAFAKTLRDGGLDTLGVWTVDDPEVARHFAALNVFAITTNRPAYIRAAICVGK